MFSQSAHHEAAEQTIPWLLLLFRPRLTLSFASGDLGPTFVVGDITYRAKVEGELTGFYDRLYDELDALAGLRITPLLAETYLPGVLAQLPYVRQVENGKAFEVYFSGGPVLRSHLVGDQAFGGRIYETIDGQFAVSLDTFFLSADEREALRSTEAEWVEVQHPPKRA